MNKLKEFEVKINDKELLKKVRGLSTIPDDTNEFSKIVSFEESENIFLNLEKRNKIADKLFTKAQLKKITTSDLTYCIAYAYEWVYGFIDEKGKWKVTPNVPNMEKGIPNELANEIIKLTSEIETLSKKITEDNAQEVIKEIKEIDTSSKKIILDFIGAKEDELSDWESALAVKQVTDFIFNPMNTAMGLLLRN